jgi:hypothetical protein
MVIAMTLNRMGSTRGKINRKAWLTGTLTLGAVAASGGVAMASLHEEPKSKIAPASQSFMAHDEDEDKDKDKDKAKEIEKAKGQVCLRLDKRAQKAVHDAEAVAKGGTITVPLNKVEVVPCKGAPTPKPAPTTPSAPASTDSGSKPPAPKPTATTAPTPKPTTPKPTVTSTPS